MHGEHTGGSSDRLFLLRRPKDGTLTGYLCGPIFGYRVGVRSLILYFTLIEVINAAACGKMENSCLLLGLLMFSKNPFPIRLNC